MKIRYLQFPGELLDTLTHSSSAPKIQSIHFVKTLAKESESFLLSVVKKWIKKNITGNIISLDRILLIRQFLAGLWKKGLAAFLWATGSEWWNLNGWEKQHLTHFTFHSATYNLKCQSNAPAVLAAWVGTFKSVFGVQFFSVCEYV